MTQEAPTIEDAYFYHEEAVADLYVDDTDEAEYQIGHRADGTPVTITLHGRRYEDYVDVERVGIQPEPDFEYAALVASTGYDEIADLANASGDRRQKLEELLGRFNTSFERVDLKDGEALYYLTGSMAELDEAEMTLRELGR